MKKDENWGKQNSTILRLQLLAIGFVVLLVFHTFGETFFNTLPLLAVNALLALYFFYLLFVSAKNVFGTEFKKIAVFFLALFALVQAMWAVTLIVQEYEMRFNISFGLIFLLFALFIFARFGLSKGNAKGKVLSSSGGVTVVETPFNLGSFSKAERYVVESQKKYSVGKEVEVKVRKGFFSGEKAEILE